MSSPSPSAVRRTAGNAAALVAAYVVGRGLTFVAVVVAARVVGTGDFGTYGTAAALAVMVSLVSTLGMVPLLVRQMTRSPDEAAGWLAAADRVKHGSNVLMLGLLWWVAGPLLELGATAVSATLLLGAAYALGSYAENRLAWSRAVERMSLVTWASTVYGVATGAAGVAVLAATGSVVAFCGAPLVGQAAVLVYLRSRLPPELRGGRARARKGQVRELVRSTVPFAGGFVLLTLFYKVDVLLLERWRSREEVGLYVAAYRFVDLAHALALAAVGAVYPALARRAGRRAGPGEAGPDRVGSRVGELAVLAWAPLAAALFLAREAAVVGVFGGEYAGAVPVLALLAPAIPALAFNLYAAHLLGAADRMRWMVAVFGGGLMLKVGLDVLLIPARGAPGAAAATLASEVAVAGAFVVVLGRALGAAPGAGAGGTVAGVVLLAAGGVLLPAPAGGVVAAAALLSATGVLYRILGVITPGEWSAVKGALGRSGAAPGGGASGPSGPPSPGSPSRGGRHGGSSPGDARRTRSPSRGGRHGAPSPGSGPRAGSSSAGRGPAGPTAPGVDGAG